METLTTINQRRAIRQYTGEKPTEAQLKQVLTAAESAPVAMGQFDRYHLTVIEDPALITAINQAAGKVFSSSNPMLYGAPVLVVVSVKGEAKALTNADYASAGIIAHTMALAATDLGVGTCYIWAAVAAINQTPDVLAKLNLLAGFVPTCAVTLGATTDKYTARDVDETRIGITKL